MESITAGRPKRQRRPVERAQSEWVTAAEGAKRLDVVRATFKKIAEVNRIRMRLIPGLGHLRYFGPDIDALAEASIVKPGQVEEGAISR